MGDRCVIAIGLEITIKDSDILREIAKWLIDNEFYGLTVDIVDHSEYSIKIPYTSAWGIKKIAKKLRSHDLLEG